MPEHRVKFSIPYRVLGRSDIKFKIYDHRRRHPDALLGTLYVSHGAIEWRPARKKTKIKLDWPDFDRRMQNN